MLKCAIMMKEQENIRHKDVQEVKAGIKSLLAKLNAIYPNKENKSEMEQLKQFILMIKTIPKF